MQIQYCSISGADESIAITDLSLISAEYPFVEWGIGFAPALAGQPRFPGTAWIAEFVKAYEGHHAALHLHDDAVLGFIGGDADILRLMSNFRRVQLDLQSDRVRGQYDPAGLADRVRYSPQWDFILQYSSREEGLLPLFLDIPNHALLFDNSAGRGKIPKIRPPSIAGHVCGYAGGIGPRNIAETLRAIARIAPHRVTWINMESGVRTGDRLDLDKVRQVLKIAAPYAAESPPVRAF